MVCSFSAQSNKFTKIWPIIFTSFRLAIAVRTALRVAVVAAIALIAGVTGVTAVAGVAVAIAAAVAGFTGAALIVVKQIYKNVIHTLSSLLLCKI